MILPYIELAAGCYMLAVPNFITTDNTRSTVILKMPMSVFGAFLLFDALSRTGWV